MRDCHAKGATNKLTGWLRRRRFRTFFGRGCDDCVEFDEETGGGEISINSRFGAEAQLYTLLHEAGHVLNHQKQDKNYGKTVLRDGRTQISKLYVVAEELSAWEQGRHIARRLNLRINKTTYNRLTSRYVMTYVRWLSKAWTRSPSRRQHTLRRQHLKLV